MRKCFLHTPSLCLSGPQGSVPPLAAPSQAPPQNWFHASVWAASALATLEKGIISVSCIVLNPIPKMGSGLGGPPCPHCCGGGRKGELARAGKKEGVPKTTAPSPQPQNTHTLGLLPWTCMGLCQQRTEGWPLGQVCACQSHGSKGLCYRGRDPVTAGGCVQLPPTPRMPWWVLSFLSLPPPLLCIRVPRRELKDSDAPAPISDIPHQVKLPAFPCLHIHHDDQLCHPPGAGGAQLPLCNCATARLAGYLSACLECDGLGLTDLLHLWPAAGGDV